MYKDIRKYLKLPDLLSIMGIVFSLGAIYFALNKEFLISVSCLLVAAFFDNMDGRLARRMKREGRFGVELDSLADVITFLIVPVIFAYMAGADSMLALMIYALFIVSGILRLSRFNVTGTIEGYYQGLPVGYNGIIPIVYMGFIYAHIGIQYLIGFFLISAILMVSSVKIKKF